jgi:hypothetical protein
MIILALSYWKLKNSEIIPKQTIYLITLFQNLSKKIKNNYHTKFY